VLRKLKAACEQLLSRDGPIVGWIASWKATLPRR
jgi:hypothetical protein